MKIQRIFYSDDNRFRTVWRILIFIALLSLSLSPLFLINNTYLQFLGAVFVLIFGLLFNAKYIDKRDFSAYGLVFKKATFIHLFVGMLIGIFSVVSILIIGRLTGSLSVSKLSFIPPTSLLLFLLLKCFSSEF